MMHITVSPDATSLGLNAALETAEILREAIAKDGCARIIRSTGASQFTTLEALIAQPGIDWSKVEMFHLDEYVNLPITHIASFRKYLQERFVDKVHPGKVNFVDGTPECIAKLTEELNKGPIFRFDRVLQHRLPKDQGRHPQIHEYLLTFGRRFRHSPHRTASRFRL